MNKNRAPVNALILAGAPNEGKLKECSSVPWEALIPVGSKTILEYVFDALRGSANIGKIAIVGPSALIKESLKGSEGALFLESGDSLLDNLLIGLEALEGTGQILIATSDIPLLTPAAVDDFLERCGREEADLYYSVIPKEKVGEKYSATKRTYVRLADGIFTGGNLALVSPEALIRCQDIVQRVYSMRKKPLQLARLLGLRCLVKILFNTLSIKEIEARVEKLFALKGMAVITPYPEIGVDVDKPEDLIFVREFLEL